jgi:transglutaminase-like putative cysteine protease
VGLCRATGIPAREVFGLRVAHSKLSKSIGKEGDVSGGQHCRAEFFSASRGGWVPVDPADVRKVILEESLSLESPHVNELRKKFFGFWEMNWVAFNSARDFLLPPSPGTAVNYLMYPYYAAGSFIKDGMDPKDFQYTILAKEV